VNNNKILDNLTGQEIKEMITRQEINLEDISIPALNSLFEYESELVCQGKGDGGLLCRCADVLAQKEGIAEEHDKVFAAMLDSVMQPFLSPVQPKKKHYRLKKVFLIAAAVIALVCSATLVAAAFGFDVFACFRELILSPAGAKMEENGITLVHNGETTVYCSIEELLKTAQMEIMYPAKLPDGISVTTVDVFTGVNAEEMVCIKTTDPQTIFFVQLKATDTGGSHKDCEIITKKGKTFYIRKDLNFAFSYFAGNYYSFQSGNYEQLQYILDNLEE
jgi:hypothetical protein